MHVNVSVGKRHCVCLCRDDHDGGVIAYAWGSGASLGTTNTSSRSAYEFCGLGHSIVHIASMYIQSSPVSPSLQGQLGRGKGLGSCTPLNVPMDALLHSNERIIEVACGANHSAIVTNMGVLITFGAGMHGQILYTAHVSSLKLIISVWKLKISILCICRPDRTWNL